MSEFTFWQDGEAVTLTADEYAVWKAQSGARLLNFATDVCRRAVDDLPRGTVNLTLPPELLPELAPHVDHAHIAYDVLFAVVQQIPQNCPLPADYTQGQARAWNVLDALRGSVMAAHGVPAAQALPIIEAALGLGVAAARAHVEPYQGKVAGKLKQERALSHRNREANTASTIEATERYARWQQAAARIWSEHPTWNASDVARHIAADQTLPGVNFDHIRRKIKKPR